jgi:glycosyltransferase involved in cell wall biosynthesis
MIGPRIIHVDTERGWRGGQNQVYLLHRGLIAAGVDSLVLCRANQPLAARLAAEGLPHQVVGGALSTCWAVRRLAASPGTIFHAHAARAHDLTSLALTGLRCPLVVTRRVDFALAPSLRSRWKYGQRMRICVAVSQAVKAVLVRGGVTAERIEVIYDGIDPLTAAANSAGLPAGRILVLCSAAFTEHKGHRHLLEAWRVIEAAGLPATLLLAGRGELEMSLRQQAADLHHVQFLGWRDDLPRLWATVDLGVLASVEEGLGSTLIEAQFAGVPVVATTAGGIPELITDEQTGLLVPPGDPAALASALMRLIGDDAARQRLGAQAKLNAEKFTLTVMVERYRHLYQRIAAI